MSHTLQNHIFSPYPTIIEKLVKWYDQNHEIFLWRESHDPFRIWISEVMLQQTTIATVIPYYERFLKRFQTLQTLAESEIDEVLTYWQGLGYYRRAHMLHKGAKYMLDTHEGLFPRNYKDLLKVPGIGKYTAKAILSIAFHEPFVPVDGNVIRVFSRLFGKKEAFENLEKSLHPEINDFEENLNGQKTDYFAQSLMDLGREICKPRNPKCEICPISGHCAAFSQDLTAVIPSPKKREKVPTKYAHCSIFEKEGGIFLIKNTKKGLFEGMWSLPMSEILEKKENNEESTHLGTIFHTFTHFKLVLEVHFGNKAPENCVFVKISELDYYALPTLMKKALKLFHVHNLQRAA